MGGDGGLGGRGARQLLVLSDDDRCSYSLFFCVCFSFGCFFFPSRRRGRDVMTQSALVVAQFLRQRARAETTTAALNYLGMLYKMLNLPWRQTASARSHSGRRRQTHRATSPDHNQNLGCAQNQPNASGATLLSPLSLSPLPLTPAPPPKPLSPPLPPLSS